MSTSTCSGGWALSSGSEDTYIESWSETSCLSEYESDLEDLYKSFDFEDSASRSLSSAQAQETCDNEVPQQETVGHLFSTSGEALYAGSPISTLQSYYSSTPCATALLRRRLLNYFSYCQCIYLEGLDSQKLFTVLNAFLSMHFLKHRQCSTFTVVGPCLLQEQVALEVDVVGGNAVLTLQSPFYHR